jgi:hypothetical protein
VLSGGAEPVGVVARGRPRHSHVPVDRVDELVRGVRPRLVGALLAAVGTVIVASPAVALGALPANVAVVVGTPITRQVLDHWMFVGVKTDTKPGEALIVPTDPPRFDRCVARVRALIPGLQRISSHTLRSDCAVLFHQVAGQELDLLIMADWEKSEAAADGILITAAQVDHAYHVDTRRQFGTPARFRRYLRRTGETIADVRFRVRVALVHAALLKAEHLTESALGGELKQSFKPQTACARFYMVSDCRPGAVAGASRGEGLTINVPFPW